MRAQWIQFLIHMLLGNDGLKVEPDITPSRQAGHFVQQTVSLFVHHRKQHRQTAAEFVQIVQATGQQAFTQ